MDQVRIGAFIAQLRREKGWTQEELGERLRVTRRSPAGRMGTIPWFINCGSEDFVE